MPFMPRRWVQSARPLSRCAALERAGLPVEPPLEPLRWLPPCLCIQAGQERGGCRMGWSQMMEVDVKRRGALPGQGGQPADWVHCLLPLPFKSQAMLSLLLLSLAQAPAPCLPSEILPASGTASPSFGEIMAVDGDRLMVAADSGGGSLDVIKVFERDAVGGGWSEVQEVALTPSQGSHVTDLDLDGDRAVVVAADMGLLVYKSWGLERDPASGLWDGAWRSKAPR